MDEIGIIKEVTLSSGILRWRKDDIIEIILAEGKDPNVDEIRVLIDYIGEWGNGRKFKSMIIMPDFENISYEVREFSASEEGSRYTLADAFVISSIAMQLIGNFYLKFHKPIAPTKIFTKKEDAVQWLHSLPNKD